MLRIRERRATQAQVAERLGLSVCRVERMCRAYKAGGAAALVSKERGAHALASSSSSFRGRARRSRSAYALRS